MNEAQIIEGCRQGQTRAQKMLFDSFCRPMLVTCIRFVRNRADAEELMLNGFYKFFTQIDKFRYSGPGSIQPWLKKIMINECLMFLRKRGQLILVDEKMDNDLQALEPEVFTKISSRELYDAMERLSAGYRTIFNLYVIEEMSHKEIGALLGISTGTSKSQLSKARIALQQIIKKKGGYHERFR